MAKDGQTTTKLIMKDGLYQTVLCSSGGLVTARHISLCPAHDGGTGQAEYSEANV